MVGIYKITNQETGKIYIGKSKDIWNRWRTHEKQLRENVHHNKDMQLDYNNAIDKNNIFSYEIVETCSEEELEDRERFYIKEFKSIFSTNGYNIRGEGLECNKFTLEDDYNLYDLLKITTDTGYYLFENVMSKFTENHYYGLYAIIKTIFYNKDSKVAIVNHTALYEIIQSQENTQRKCVIDFFNFCLSNELMKMYIHHDYILGNDNPLTHIDSFNGSYVIIFNEDDNDKKYSIDNKQFSIIIKYIHANCKRGFQKYTFMKIYLWFITEQDFDDLEIGIDAFVKNTLLLKDIFVN